jgi:hypothetical protein
MVRSRPAVETAPLYRMSLDYLLHVGILESEGDVMRRNIVHVVTLALALLVAAPLAAEWSTLSIDQTYPSWHRDPDGTLFNDVLSLSPDNFNNQVLSNPHIQYNDDGQWLIMGYGDSSLGETTVGDAIYVMKRLNTGWYKVPASAALKFPAALSGSDWTSVGGLGVGAGIAKTSNRTPDPYNYKYFAVVQVAQAPWNANKGAFTRGWTTWAVSTDGEDWYFVAQSGGTTRDAGESLQLIRRADLAQLTSTGMNRFWHIAMVYNPSDNYFYIVMGWAEEGGGIKGTWWRVRYNQGNAYGLPVNASTGAPEVEVLAFNSVTQTYSFTRTTTVGSGAVSDGLITDYSDAWANQAQSPVASGPADPSDLVELYKADGSVDSMLFIYAPESGLNDSLYYVKGTLPTDPTANIIWNTPQALDFSSLTNAGYNTTCGAGGFRIGVNQSGSQSTDGLHGLPGAPNLYGFAATWLPDQHLPASGGCVAQPQGLLPLHFKLN